MPPADATHVSEAQKRAPAELKNVVEFLRGKNGPKVRRGILDGKRVEYFRGKTAIRTLLGPAYQKLKKVPTVTNEDEAKALMLRILPHAFFLRVEKANPDNPPPPGIPKPLLLAPQQVFDIEKQYAWFYDGSPIYTMIGGVAMIAVMLAGVMFPLWPVKLRLGVWYLSVGALILIGLFIVLAIVRLIFWCLTALTMKRAIWIFPNLFEDVGFVDSFIPLWAYDEPKKKKKRVLKGSKKSDKATVTATGGLAPATEAVAEAAGIPTEGAAPETTSTSASASGSAGLRSRQSATVEEAEDDDN